MGKKRLITWIEQTMEGRSEPMTSNEIMKIISDKHPKHSPSTQEVSQRLTRGKQFVRIGYIRKKALWGLGELDE